MCGLSSRISFFTNLNAGSVPVSLKKAEASFIWNFNYNKGIYKEAGFLLEK